MNNYVAPARDMNFVLNELSGLDQIQKLSAYEEATPDLVEAVIE
ncbi:MAG: hypothetical protein GTO60_13435, partial [Gammaproteobacteria bacterium]|nr:hypothetical protein [Gammaproteobacteria bacterium]NIO63262.1 hypothetical protein [Gammaproteobacteria bacterium]